MQCEFSDSCKLCVICGNESCTEAYDHTRVDMRNLQRILQIARVPTSRINEIIIRVKNHYEHLCRSLMRMLKQDENNVVQSLRRLDYEHLEEKRLPMKLLTEVVCGNYASLPTKKLIPLMEELTQPRVLKQMQQQQSHIELIVENHIKSQHYQTMISKFQKNALLYPQIKQQFDSQPKLGRKVSIRRIDNPEQNQKIDNISFQLRGVTYQPRIKELQISNRNVNDSDILAHIGAIKHFPFMSSIEMRDNQITSLSCKLIGSNLPHLSKVDIRGNRVGDSGVSVLARNVRGMKEFYICETGATDDSIDVIIEHLKCLTLLWAKKNKLTLKAADKIINHESLKAIGLQGNPLSIQDIASLKTSYRRGYLSI